MKKSNIDENNQGNYEKIQSLATYLPHHLLNLFSLNKAGYTVDKTVNKKEYGDVIGQLLIGQL